MSDFLLGVMLGSAIGAFLGMIGLATMQAFVRRDALAEHYDREGK